LTHDEKQLTMFDIEEAPGRPMLHWLGKRPLRAVKYYEAQLKEQYGEPAEDGWVNRLYWGDNLQVMSHLMKDFRGKIKLIYIDPPFDSKADYRKRIKLRGKQLESHTSVIEEKQYTDIWANDLYLQFMYERLQLMRELLSDDGSIYIHCDWRKSHHLRVIMDEIFGDGGENGDGPGFKGELIWCYRTRQFSKNYWNRKHHTILFYTKSSIWTFNWEAVMSTYSEATIKKYRFEDEKGKYRLVGRGIKGSPIQSAKDVDPIWEQTHPELVKRDYLKKGYPPEDWMVIDIENQASNERTNFPTQKPVELLKRIIKASSNENDLIADFFCGSGTTLAVAQKLGRRWIGSDLNLGAIHTTARRVSQIIKEQLKETQQQTFLDEGKKFYAAFAVYNVNHYDIFKNALEAKEIVMKLYGVEPVKRSFFDGLLDGKWVKVVELNRVCSKEDVQAVFDEILSKGEKEIEATYRRGVLILCSGHEYDVLDYAKRLNVVNIPFEIRDILTDRKDIIFKRPPEADIALRLDGGKAVVEIRQFYSPMLLQKLQLEDDPEEIDDWRQLVEAVLIDPNYDGEVLKPAIQDIPGKKDMASGVYELPLTGPGQKIAVKIVDVLSEEYFEVLEVGAR